MKNVVQLAVFRKEIAEFPAKTREDIFSLLYRYLNNERLSSNDFKTFRIDGKITIQEFKVKDAFGNWRVISCVFQKNTLVLLHAFHKKSQRLLESDKHIVRQRIKGINL